MESKIKNEISGKDTTKEGIARRKIQRGQERFSVLPQRKIALGILEDVMDRRGIKNEFEQCDPEVIQEILSDWEEIARVAMPG
jgi:hypothetical protein